MVEKSVFGFPQIRKIFLKPENKKPELFFEAFGFFLCRLKSIQNFAERYCLTSV